mmetsp:Transcript_10259/g.17929  ORF Transcript_10259/g.17929 Transcript_10259/m.17929 type:complete len:332 (-) Transcript_10259:841-1836(-)
MPTLNKPNHQSRSLPLPSGPLWPPLLLLERPHVSSHRRPQLLPTSPLGSPLPTCTSSSKATPSPCTSPPKLVAPLPPLRPAHPTPPRPPAPPSPRPATPTPPDFRFPSSARTPPLPPSPAPPLGAAPHHISAPPQTPLLTVPSSPPPPSPRTRSPTRTSSTSPHPTCRFTASTIPTASFTYSATSSALAREHPLMLKGRDLFWRYRWSSPQTVSNPEIQTSFLPTIPFRQEAYNWSIERSLRHPIGFVLVLTCDKITSIPPSSSSAYLLVLSLSSFWFWSKYLFPLRFFSLKFRFGSSSLHEARSAGNASLQRIPSLPRILPALFIRRHVN